MSVDSDVENEFEKETGMVAMQTQVGINAFNYGVISKEPQLLVVEGYTKVLKEKYIDVLNGKEVVESLSKKAVVFDEILRLKAIAYIKAVISNGIRLKTEALKENTPFESYGIDSIMVTKLTKVLEEQFGKLSTTIFYEYQTVAELTDYFIKEHSSRLSELLDITKSEASTKSLNEEKIEKKSRQKGRLSFKDIVDKQGNDVTNNNFDIAIVGISGRYPGANNANELWDNLVNGKDCITEIPKERWDYTKYYDPRPNIEGKVRSKWGGFIDGVDEFDPLFFNISPREAEKMDPQERLFLQCAYETIQDAGYTRDALSKYRANGLEGNVGVFVGVMYEEYQLYGAQEQVKGSNIALAGNPSSIANRVSYTFNLHGPSLSVDTMCSSSLTALYLACQSIRTNACEMAIAGGVNVSIHPNKYITLGAGNFVSSRGRCESFGKYGDGYVPGEGIGAVLLKPLEKAIADGDHIYGVVKGIAINHGGKTNGYTVPNLKAQKNVIDSAIKASGINPRQITYIEAHGTGTSLGDPIEIEGLTKSFAAYTSDKQYCAIGSVKSNIGHTESASGIAGIIKVLLQMKHKKLVPSLHAQELNPNIDFESTPFVVQRELSNWERVDGKPLAASVSSFGAGGSNAHVIVEEYIPNVVTDSTANETQFIVLSARNEEGLEIEAKQLLEHIIKKNFTDKELSSIAYTLQVGREEMAERVAFIVNNMAELKERLNQFINKESYIKDCYRGSSNNQNNMFKFTQYEEMKQMVRSWLNNRVAEKFLEAWINGIALDWNELYKAGKPQKISLPTYPFEKEHYWIEQSSINQSMLMGIAGNKMHPLVQINTSDVFEQKYSTVFTGEEFYLTDHVINGEKVLPGAAYLEMAYQAVKIAVKDVVEGNYSIKLQDICWRMPFVNSEANSINISLESLSDTELRFNIYSVEDDIQKGYCEGKACLIDKEKSPSIDIKSLQNSLKSQEISKEECYKVFKKGNITYGVAHQVIEKMYAGSQSVLTNIHLPEQLQETFNEYMLHPSLIDGAIQSCIGMGLQEKEEKVEVPYSLDSVEVYDALSDNMWVYVTSNQMDKCNIELCDESGKVAVRLKGLATKKMRLQATDTVMYVPSWVAASEIENQTKQFDEKYVLVYGDDEKSNLIKGLGYDVARYTKVNVNDLANAYEKDAIELFNFIKEKQAAHIQGKVLLQVVVLKQKAEMSVYEGLLGLIKTVQGENPNIYTQLLVVEDDIDTNVLASKLEESSKNISEAKILYSGDKRYTVKWQEIQNVKTSENIIWRENGVYVITGGMGGLGILFAKEIVNKNQKARVILIGRSELDNAKKAVLDEINGQVVYKQADLSKEDSVTKVVNQIVNEYGKINGILHSAGVIKDQLIIKKSVQEFKQVLAPKVRGVENLDKATKNIDVDFIMLFSSITSINGNIGQSDYAVANGFMDMYASYRNRLVENGQRKGQTYVINWPLWAEGGMQVSEAISKDIKKQFGMHPMQTETGIKAFYDVLELPYTQVMVVEGEASKLRRTLLAQINGEIKESEEVVVNTQVSISTHDDLQDKAVNYIKEIVSKIIKLTPNKIDESAQLEKYGIDSVMVMQLTDQLELTFGQLPKTLFFEYQTIAELTKYLLENYEAQFAKALDIVVNAGEVVEEKATNVLESSNQGFKVKRKNKVGRNVTLRSADQPLDIAIIGLAGKYPGANNLDELWRSLTEGKDCITEIPKERWNFEEYYDPNGKEGKVRSKWGGFIEGVDEFDPLFFNISPREAERMDPQERLFLECAYQTIQDAGYTRKELSEYNKNGLEGNIGVFVGAMYEEYQLYGAQEQLRGNNICLAGNPSSIANRVSYTFNLHGPSMTVDTMCSSSLTAISLACQSIRNEQCEMAIAGGVNVSIHPNKYIGLGQGNFVSSKGRCETFGEGGDGYVPGEGVGAVLLKPLEQAIADGDQIYGVIKALEINHGGKTNGFTVPNLKAQENVINRAIKVSGINPREMSYIEAHGTGTALGDPIEIDALNKSFKQYTSDKQYCAIGSIKSNIGHTESASGIAGITKVLLQMKYGKLVPSLHSEVLNTNIDFANTPFKVQRSLTDWKRPVIEGKTEKLTAGISSFGAGGSNAHLILQEYTDTYSHNEVGEFKEYIIVLSAKTEERLKLQVANLKEVIEKSKFDNNDLVNIAYTLQTGREAMEERIAFVVKSIEELKEKLQLFLNNESYIGECYRGSINQYEEINKFIQSEDIKQVIKSWISQKRYTKFIELWVKGIEVEWKLLYNKKLPKKISLPTYPFEQEHYWIETDKNFNSLGHVTQIHPLVQKNTSDVFEQRYTTAFTGQEFFLADHKVGGRKILPGAAYLEMAYIAIKEAINNTIESEYSINLEEIIWRYPLVCDESQEVNISLELVSDTELRFEVYDARVENNGQKIYCEGIATIDRKDSEKIVDIESIKQECNEEEISAEDCYKVLSKNGINYGLSHKVVKNIYCGQNSLLVQLQLPDQLKGSFKQYTLHPSLIDGAIHGSVGLSIHNNLENVGIPFTVNKVKVYGALEENMWAHIVEVRANECNIKLYDSQGALKVELGSLVTKSITDYKVNNTSVMLWKSEWIKHTAAAINEISAEEHYVFAYGLTNNYDLSAELNKLFTKCHFTYQKVDVEDLAHSYEEACLEIFNNLKECLNTKVTKKVLIQILVLEEVEALQTYEGLLGLIETASLENPNVSVQFVGIREIDNKDKIAHNVYNASLESRYNKLIYINNESYVQSWKEFKGIIKENGIPWKENGIYLITGGMGGLGYIFAKEITKHISSGKVILLGRSRLSQQYQEKLADLERKGIEVTYKQVDVTSEREVTQTIQEVVNEYGNINGIIHSAGIIKDHLIIKKTEDEYKKVLGPKVKGIVNLDKATKDLKLDLFIAFSSITGIKGNIGQSDYAAANGFMDAYCAYRNQLTKLGKRQGRAYSINWPLWNNGGMNIDKRIVTALQEKLGMSTLETTVGLQAFYEVLNTEENQVLVVQGKASKLRRTLFETQQNSKLSKLNNAQTKTARVDEDIRIRTQNYIKKVVADIIKLSPNKVDINKQFEDYGIDSVMIMQLTSELEKTFGEISKTIFFECQTIAEVTKYFIENFANVINELLMPKTQAVANETTEETTEEISLELTDAAPIKMKKHSRMNVKGSVLAKQQDIAIIGLAGKYPGANNVEELWNVLANGQDCITEIPKDRWDYSKYYDPDRNAKGKACSKWGGFIDGIDKFDPLFFNISPSAVEKIDPQERLFLQCAYETIEDAGYTKESLSQYKTNGLEGNVGVFVGVMYEEYQLYGAQEQQKGINVALGGNPSSIANRVSYTFNLHGPSIALDTMCSSSLTAIYLACQSIRTNECELAIAGGVNLSVHPNKYVALGQGKFVSSDGRCRTFGKDGDGYVPGEGVGAILLKPLDRAIQDGDHIYGVIKGIAINHGGKTNGYTVPNVKAQKNVIEKAINESGINPRTISYIEAHGTGTALGDPIEIDSLNKAFGNYGAEKQYCAIGSIKSNIGHTESASGIAGITKILLQLKHKKLVPSLHSAQLNPNINFAETPFKVQQELADWKRPVVQDKEQPLRAGISSFGAGGSNAHLIIEEYMQPKNNVNVKEQEAKVIVLSAKTEERLMVVAERFKHKLEQQQFSDADLLNIAYTLQVGREGLNIRIAFIVNNLKELQEKLTSFIEGKDYIPGCYRTQASSAKEVLDVIQYEDIKYVINEWIKDKQYDKFLDLWVKGIDIDWNLMYGNSKPSKMSLPTYPFEEEKYWIDITPNYQLVEQTNKLIGNMMHPLVQYNISDVTEQRYGSSLMEVNFS